MERNIYKIEKELFITSDEEIKDGDWMIRGNEQPTLVTPNFFWDFGVRYYKIILTTDQDLIKDGIQAIDNEFLEWFVKNPSCEYVDTVLQHQYHSSKELYLDAGYVDCTKEQYNSIKTEIPTCPLKVLYKIIIPQEEPTISKEAKERAKNYMSLKGALEPNQIKCYCGHTSYCDCSPLDEPKQETLEEAAERILANNIDGLRDALKDDDLFFFYKGVIQCYGEAMAKWQQERSYSEAIEFAEWIRIKDFQTTSKNNWIGLDMRYYTTEELFEQFKKK